jgi:hypothetical protein
MAYGLTEVSYDSCVYNLTAGPGRSIVIVIGGASEALEVSIWYENFHRVSQLQ